MPLTIAPTVDESTAAPAPAAFHATSLTRVIRYLRDWISTGDRDIEGPRVIRP